jgi:hypothetical protein
LRTVLLKNWRDSARCRESTYLTWLSRLTFGMPSAEQVAIVAGQMPSRQ